MDKTIFENFYPCPPACVRVLEKGCQVAKLPLRSDVLLVEHHLLGGAHYHKESADAVLTGTLKAIPFGFPLWAHHPHCLVGVENLHVGKLKAERLAPLLKAAARDIRRRGGARGGATGEGRAENKEVEGDAT